MVRFCQFSSSDFCDLCFSQIRKPEWRGLALYKVLPVEAKKIKNTSNHERCVDSLEISFRVLASLMTKKGSFNIYLRIKFLGTSALAEIITMGLTHLWTWEALSEYGGKSTQDEVRAFVPWQLRDTGSQIGLGKKRRHYSSSSLIWSWQTYHFRHKHSEQHAFLGGCCKSEAYWCLVWRFMFHDPILTTASF